jgi:hypothetical protein
MTAGELASSGWSDYDRCPRCRVLAGAPCLNLTLRNPPGSRRPLRITSKPHAGRRLRPALERTNRP